ncbi:MAG: hypothetical protein ACRDSL_25230 [Pseudonocardiaceae bacterium]
MTWWTPRTGHSPCSKEQVRSALSAIQDPGRDAIELAGAIEGWTAERLTQAR